MKLKIIFLLLFLSLPLSAKEPGNIVEDLGLSETQMEQIQQHMQARESKKELFEKIRNSRDNIRDELAKQDPDRAKIDTLIEEHTLLMKRQLTNMVESTLEMKQILSKEQYQKWRRNMERGRERAPRGDRKNGNYKNRN